jgi:hypothetical protein
VGNSSFLKVLGSNFLKTAHPNSASQLDPPIPVRLLPHIPESLCGHLLLCRSVPPANHQIQHTTTFVKVVVDRSNTMFVGVVVLMWNLMLKVVRNAKQLATI